jgi:phosphohistidine phosphatase
MTETTKPVALHLLRHADAGDAEAWQGDDDVRPLSDKGKRQAERLGRHLAQAGFDPDLILSSPKLRASQTADIVAKALAKSVELDDRLGGQVGLGTIDAVLKKHGSARRPVLVGHDPDFSDLLAILVGAPTLPMKKGALARIDLVIGVEPGGGVLRWLLPADALPRES